MLAVGTVAGGMLRGRQRDVVPATFMLGDRQIVGQWILLGLAFQSFGVPLAYASRDSAHLRKLLVLNLILKVLQVA